MPFVLIKDERHFFAVPLYFLNKTLFKILFKQLYNFDIPRGWSWDI